jgi:TolB protein
MTRTYLAGGLLAAVAAAVVLAAPQQPPAQAPTSTPAPQQPNEISTTISSGERGAQTRIAVPDFLALTNDRETQDAARTIARVLWDDLNFEHEYALIPRDVAATVPAAASLDNAPLDRWRELNADGVVIGTVRKDPNGVVVQIRLFNVRSGQSAFGQEYSGSIANPRSYAHKISDEIHFQQRSLRGVAQTKLAFTSDRDAERLTGTVEHRGAKEIYIADYDGENQRRVTVNFALNLSPAWSPDGRTLAYASWWQCVQQRCGSSPGNIFLQNIFDGTPRQELTVNAGGNWLPAWSPDGSRIAFTSDRVPPGGTASNSDIYVMNKDGSNLRRLTTSPAIDISPTWSPSGNQIAFISDRTGAPQIWIMEADGLSAHQITHESKVDKPTWSPAPYNEIAYSANFGTGNDIKIIDLATQQVRQLTNGEGNNESPVFSPNGRHIAFRSSRAGKDQIFTISRTGQDLRQITKAGANTYPSWSRGPEIK